MIYIVGRAQCSRLALGFVMCLLFVSSTAQHQSKPAAATTAPPQAGSTFRDCEGCPRMIIVPAGSFQMGSTRSEQDWAVQQGRKRDSADREAPPHEVTISKPFAVGMYEVTRDEFFAFARETAWSAGKRCNTFEEVQGKYMRADREDRDWRNSGQPQTGDHPVGCVTWDDASAFAVWLSRKTGQRYRLLSEAEWEYVARAGTHTYAYWGDDVSSPQSCKFANVGDQTPFPNGETWPTRLSCNDGYWATSPVGKFLPNAFGVYDLLGNVWEWVDDCAHPNYEGAPVDGSAWTIQGHCDARVLRGGAFYENGASIRAAVRGKSEPQLRFDNSGFRVARDL